jgi:hypothetical protein
MGRIFEELFVENFPKIFSIKFFHKSLKIVLLSYNEQQVLIQNLYSDHFHPE